MDNLIEFGTYISKYDQIDNNTFIAYPKLHEFGYKAFIKCETSEDLIRIDIIYLYGKIVINSNDDINELLSMMLKNTGSYSFSSAYLGGMIMDDDIYLTVNSNKFFLTKWDDKDIADIIQVQFMDILGAEMTWQFPNAVKTFYELTTGKR